MHRFYATFGLSMLACLAGSSGVAAAQATLRPVPEYAPVDTVIVSEDLFNYDYHASELTAAIIEAQAKISVATPAPRSKAQFAKLLASAGIPTKSLPRFSAVALPHDNIWLRDYAPIPLAAHTSTGVNLGLADLRLESSSKINDALPKAVGRLMKAPVVDIPVFLDGGNFLVAGDLCITTTVESPTKTTEKTHAGPLALKGDYGKALGCRQVLVLSDPPHPHLDMWAKVVSDRKVLVNEITPATLRRATSLGSDYVASQLRDALDRMARQLAQHLEVVRIPMPLPYRGAFRTYTNSLLVNGSAIVPSYRKFGWGYDDYPDGDQLPAMERRVKEVYRSLGFRVRPVNADGMIYNGGAFHCVTATLPKLDSTAKGK